MALGDKWATVDEVKSLIATPYPTDTEIETALEQATLVVDDATCVVPLDEDPEDTYPDDYKVRRAVAILAAQLLTAPKMTAAGAEDAVEAESIASYSYTTRAPQRTAATALRIDGIVKELLGGYLCPSESGNYELETIKDRHLVSTGDSDWEWDNL